MRLRVRNLIIALTAAGALVATGAATAAASSGPGTMYTIAGAGRDVIPTSGVAPGQAAFGQLAGVAADGAGDVALADGAPFGGGRNVIDLIPASNCTTNCVLGLARLHRGMAQAVIGLGSTQVPTAGEPISRAALAAPQTVSFDAAGDLAITEYGTSQVDLVANRDCSTGCPYGLPALRKGYIYRVAGGGGSGYASGASATSVGLAAPYEVTFDSRQDLIFSDSGDNYVFLVAASACASACPYGLPSMSAGKLYALAGNGNYGFSAPDAVSGTSASLSQPAGVTVDGSGDVLLADQYASTIELVAAHNCAGGCPYGLSSMQAGYIYRLSRLDALTSPLASLSDPSDVATDPVGDLLVSNVGGAQVMMIAGVSCAADCPYGLPSMSAGDPYVVAGSGVYGNGGSGVKASTAMIGSPGQLAFGANGNLFVADYNYGLLREVTGGAAELRLTASGHGSISAGGTTCSGSCTSVHAGGYRLTLTANPAAGQLLAGWIGDGCRGTGRCSPVVESGLSVKAVFATRAQLAHALAVALRHISGKNARPHAIRRHRGFRLKLTAAGAGRLTIAWYAKARHHRVLVAAGHATPAQVGQHVQVMIRLTRAGQRMLSGGSPVRVTEVATLRLSKQVSITARRPGKV